MLLRYYNQSFKPILAFLLLSVCAAQVNAVEAAATGPDPAIVEKILGVKTFEEVVETSELPLYVLFTAPQDRCPACANVEKLLHSVAPGFAGRARFATVNIIYHMPLAGQYAIKGVPYFIMFRDGERVVSASGMHMTTAANLQNYIKSTLNRKPGIPGKNASKPPQPTEQVKKGRVDVAKFNKFAYERYVVNAKTPVLINISSSQSWCAPCRETEKIVSDVLAQHDEPLFYLFIDIGESTNNILRLVTVMPELERQILGVPTLLFYKDGQLLDMKEGIPEKESLRSSLKIFHEGNNKVEAQ
jgi:thioredoxin 1